METVQGYVILKATTFETGHGFALGHNPGAPSPFVIWQFTEGENGHRDYYWWQSETRAAGFRCGACRPRLFILTVLYDRKIYRNMVK